ncbi:MAG: hypothetical protein GY756_03385 [bacterium]|nr:hypothetical protein [bacterium]
MQDNEFRFRTKTGICLITKDNISIERKGIRGEISENVMGNNIKKILRIYLLLGSIILIYGIYSIIIGEYLYGFIATILGILFLINVIKSRYNSASSIISRSEIESVKGKSPIPLLTRGYFKITFKENGDLKIRLIALPGIFENGLSEYKKALQIMYESGVMKSD